MNDYKKAQAEFRQKHAMKCTCELKIMLKMLDDESNLFELIKEEIEKRRMLKNRG